jgi:hypothetical protein
MLEAWRSRGRLKATSLVHQLSSFLGSVVQRLERPPVERKVAGSNPVVPALDI